jgi:hypothetical protein
MTERAPVWWKSLHEYDLKINRPFMSYNVSSHFKHSMESKNRLQYFLCAVDASVVPTRKKTLEYRVLKATSMTWIPMAK